MRVIEVNKKTIGIITNISNGLMSVDYYGQIVKYLYPSAFANYLELEDEELQEKLKEDSIDSSFEEFCKEYKMLLNQEIKYLRLTGEKRKKLLMVRGLHRKKENICMLLTLI